MRVDPMPHGQGLWLLALVLVLVAFPGPAPCQEGGTEGWVPYREELAPCLEAPYLTDAERARARGYHVALVSLAEINAGKVPPNLLERALRLRQTYLSRELDWYAQRAGPRGEKLHSVALATELLAVKGFEQARKLLADDRWPDVFGRRIGPGEPPTFARIIQDPYLLCVTRDPAWDELEVAARLLSELEMLRQAFEEIVHPLRPWKGDDPLLKLIVLRDAASLWRWRLRRAPRAPPLAHRVLDPLSTRSGAVYEGLDAPLVLSGDASFNAIFEIGARFLIDASSSPERSAGSGSVWWRYGLASWFANSVRFRDPDTGSWRYAFGGLAKEHIRTAGYALHAPGAGGGQPTRPRPVFHLLELLAGTEKWFADASYRTNLLEPASALLVSFLMDFAVDADGIVIVSPLGSARSGRYARGFEAFVESALAGDDGPAAFRRCLGIEDEESFARMVVEFDAWPAFLARKLRFGQFEKNHLIPWSLWRNPPGELAGEREDDRLFER